MHKNKKATWGLGSVLIAVFAIAIVGVLSFFAVSYGLRENTASTTETIVNTIRTSGLGAKSMLPKTPLRFKFDAYDGATAQNNESNLDFDIFYWDPDKQSELEAQGYVDCSEAVAYEVSHDISPNKLPKSAFCKINTYKMTQSFTVGNTETNFQEYLTLVQADVTSYSGNDGTRTTNVIDTGRILLVTMGEIAIATQEDVVPKAFLIT